MKYIDADHLRAEIEKTYMLEIAPWLSGVSAKSAIYDYVMPIVDSLQQEQPVIQNGKFVFPKYLYARTKDNKTIDMSYVPQDITAIEYIRNDFVEQEQPVTAVGKVFTNTDPKLLTVDSDEWQSVLGQFDNGQRVRVILVKEGQG